jgi:hypothetical protein
MKLNRSADNIIFIGVWEFACNSACGGLASGGATHAGQVLSEMPDADRHTDQRFWGLDVSLITSPRTNSTVSKSGQRGCHSPKMGRSAIEEEEKKRKATYTG